MTRWRSNELSFLRERLELKPIDVYGEFAQEFGSSSRTYGAIQKQLQKLREESELNSLDFLLEDRFEEDDFSIPDFAPPTSPTMAELAGRLVSPTRQLSETDLLNRADLEQFVEDLVEESRSARGTRQGHVHFDGDGSSLVVLLSDTHCGKKTKYFNKDIFEQRIRSLPEKIRETVEASDLDEIVVLLVGDMIEGEDIYATQAHHIDIPVIDQVQIAVRAIWAMAVDLHSEFGVRIRFETAPGNHGRMSKTANSKSNWDNVIYQTLGLIANSVGNQNIVVNVNMDSFHTFPVKDKTCLLNHHGTKHTGTPAMQNKLAGWLYTKHFDILCYGHWHQWEVGSQFGKLIMKNGSLPGADDLSEQMGVFDPPRQGWFLVREGKPISTVGFFEWENVELD